MVSDLDLSPTRLENKVKSSAGWGEGWVGECWTRSNHWAFCPAPLHLRSSREWRSFFVHGLPCSQPSSDEIPSLAINMIPLPSLENATGAPELKSPLSFFSGTFSTEVLRAAGF